MSITWRFVLPINPEPWAVGPIGVTNKGGKPRGFVGQNLQLRNYQDAVRQALIPQVAQVHRGAEVFPLTAPCELDFYFWRRLDQYENTTGRKSSRNWADATNMQKALEDALQGVITGNDRNNMRVCSQIIDQGETVVPGIVIDVRKAREFDLVGKFGTEQLATISLIFYNGDKVILDNAV